jgi:cell wall-associated NlpC family hydrolase
MSFPLKICSALAGIIMIAVSLAWAGPVDPSAAQTASETRPDAPASDKSQPSVATETAITASSETLTESLSKGMNIVSEASKYMGVPYRWGGTSPQTGFDCSGFVQFVFRHTLNIKLPRMPVDMSRLGLRVNREELAPGDLVFFNTRGGRFTHVGIYVNDSQFIHSPMPGTRVTVSRMDSTYYRHRFTYAVRITPE